MIWIFLKIYKKRSQKYSELTLLTEKLENKDFDEKLHSVETNSGKDQQSFNYKFSIDISRKYLRLLNHIRNFSAEAIKQAVESNGSNNSCSRKSKDKVCVASQSNITNGKQNII